MYEFFMFLAGVATLAMVAGLVRPSLLRLKSRWLVFLAGIVVVGILGGIAESCESDQHRQQRLQEEAIEQARRDSLAAVRAVEEARRDSIAAVEKARRKAERAREKEEKARREAAAAREQVRQDSIAFAQLSDIEKAKKWAATVLPEEDRASAFDMAERFVKKVLPTPDSVDFPGFNPYLERDDRMVRSSDDVWEYRGKLYRQYEVHIDFNAQNRFGATIRYELNCWLYNEVTDNDNWMRSKMNITDDLLIASPTTVTVGSA